MAQYDKEVTDLRTEAGALVSKAYAAGWRAGYEQARQHLIAQITARLAAKKSKARRTRRRRRKAGK